MFVYSILFFEGSRWNQNWFLS